jgi:hypothetical protein
MSDNRTRWVILNMDDETRKAVTNYAALRGQTIAQVLYDELSKVREHMAIVHSWSRDAAIAETTRSPGVA